jgi:hypothetical protein
MPWCGRHGCATVRTNSGTDTETSDLQLLLRGVLLSHALPGTLLDLHEIERAERLLDLPWGKRKDRLEGIREVHCVRCSRTLGRSEQKQDVRNGAVGRIAGTT